VTSFGSIVNEQLAFDVLRMTTPILLLALAGMITDRGGVLNIALEGLALFGAFAATLLSGVTGSILLGIIGALAAGVLLSLAFAWFSLFLRGNIFIVGLATNAFAAASTAYLAWVISGREGSLRFTGAPTLQGAPLPIIERVPLLRVLSGHTIVDYCSWLLIVVVSFLVFRTRFGLRLRVVGENPEAARAIGLRVQRLQYLAIAGSGLLAGLAGASMSLSLGGFVQNMSAGRGWIGLVASIVGNGSAVGSALAALLFGTTEGVANSLQIAAQGLPTQLLFTMPFVTTLVVFVFYSARRGSKVAGDI